MTDTAHLDSIENLLSGLGTTADKATGTRPKTNAKRLTHPELDALFEGSALAMRIVEMPVADASRKPWVVVVDQADDEDNTNPFAHDIERLKLHAAMSEADRWARLYGGSAILLGLDDGGADHEPVNEASLRAVRWAKVVDRHELSPVEFYEEGPDLGEPEVYQYSPVYGGGGGRRIHASRMIRFDGLPVPRRMRAQLDWWGLSVLQPVWDRLSRFEAVEAGIGHIVHDWKIVMMKMKGFREMALSPNGTAMLTKRLTAINMGRNLTGMAILDADNEDFAQQQTPVTGLPEIYDRLAQSLAAAAGMPVTMLMGQAPSGLSTDDKSGSRSWHNVIAAHQRDRYRPAILRVVALLRDSSEGPTLPDDTSVDIDFPPLEQMTEAEKGEIRKMQAETDKIYWEMQVLGEEEIRTSRFGGPTWSAETRISDEPPQQPTGEQ